MPSKSDRIMEAVKAACASLPWVKDVRRMLASDQVKFGDHGNSQLPAILLDERVPLPVGRRAGQPPSFQTKLSIPIWVCLQAIEAEQPRTFREAMGELCEVLMADPSWGELAVDTEFNRERQAPPAKSATHLEFGVLLEITYLHKAAEL